MNAMPARPRARALLGIVDLARRLNCSARHVWWLREAGALPDPIEIGGLLRWRPEDIDRWIERCPKAVAQAKAATTKTRKTSPPPAEAPGRAGPPDPGS
jgi:predicted DNA-binding transcriptional regulator AlpA